MIECCVLDSGGFFPSELPSESLSEGGCLCPSASQYLGALPVPRCYLLIAIFTIGSIATSILNCFFGANARHSSVWCVFLSLLPPSSFRRFLGEAAASESSRDAEGTGRFEPDFSLVGAVGTSVAGLLFEPECFFVAWIDAAAEFIVLAICMITVLVRDPSKTGISLSSQLIDCLFGRHSVNRELGP